MSVGLFSTFHHPFVRRFANFYASGKSKLTSVIFLSKPEVGVDQKYADGKNGSIWVRKAKSKEVNPDVEYANGKRPGGAVWICEAKKPVKEVDPDTEYTNGTGLGGAVWVRKLKKPVKDDGTGLKGAVGACRVKEFNPDTKYADGIGLGGTVWLKDVKADGEDDGFGLGDLYAQDEHGWPNIRKKWTCNIGLYVISIVQGSLRIPLKAELAYSTHSYYNLSRVTTTPADNIFTLNVMSTHK
ncbi:uncharacterized protein LACBIDRAFT_325146 [Laccaria bicolor S238N-H82]|uniref:Predicted protein n=1 Tax=Laccaria bicolor (strain S238N-H82 / ATCC MYA-4686) TaxID=486041 RepID=B0D5B2_LACBS|nr:uncharacterized protein LACBIDRAFT_325146 [Laccaria bicolor S238N-H82]EDR10242.1 predicted protein [Laccaria bicolor S238N-H82]|eukprot:XP_001878692.1 predicted protein [Laccaria bicolor S238N-H82]